MPLSLWWFLAPIAAAIPGLLSWHWGYQVARQQGDPLFTERFWAYRKNLTFVTFFLTAFISASITLGRPGFLVATSSIVTLLLGLSIGSFLTRKQVFHETWTHSFAASSLDLRCFDSVPGRAGIDCFATDGRRTHLWRVDTREARLDPIGWTSSTLWAHDPAVGSRWVVSSGRCMWGIIDVADRSIALLPEDGRRCPYDVAIADSRLATLTRAATGEIELRVYAMSSAAGALSSIER